MYDVCMTSVHPSARQEPVWGQDVYSLLSSCLLSQAVVMLRELSCTFAIIIHARQCLPACYQLSAYAVVILW